MKRILLPVDVAEVINSVKRNLARCLYESEAEILITGSLNVLGRTELIEQVFYNVIANAINYRSEERNLKITIGCSRDNGMVKYFVTDNGIGISQQYFETVFKAFKRLHSKLAYEGTGVGLAICHKIIGMHGGEIWVDSTEGEGSTFWFTLMDAQIELPAIHAVVHAA